MMQTHEFVSRVMARGPELSRDATQQATHITLGALCEHLPAEQTRRMASQLPESLETAAEQGAKTAGKDGEHMEHIESFYRKVASRADLSSDDARGMSRAVAHTLKQAVSDGEIIDVTMDLPREMAELVSFN